MIGVVEAKLPEIGEICRLRRVRRLALFGSAVTNRFNAATSDVDLVVEFESMSPKEHADSYFGALKDFERLFGVPIDLIEPGPIRNPFFKQALATSQVVLFEAA